MNPARDPRLSQELADRQPLSIFVLSVWVVASPSKPVAGTEPTCYRRGAGVRQESMDPQAPPPIVTPPPFLARPGGGEQKSRWRWLVHLVLLGAYPVVIGIIGTLHSTSQGPALSHGARGLVLVFVIQFFVFAAVFAVAWLASRASYDQLLCHWRGGVWTVPLGLGYSVLLRLALGIVAAVVVTMLIAARVIRPEEFQHLAAANRPDVGALVDVSALRHDPVYFWLTLTLVSFVLAGFREELWRAGVLAGFRAIWPQSFGSTGGQIAAAGLAAVVFGLGHLAQGWMAACGAGLLGFGLGIIMVLHRSIWPAV
ncbi:MAG TPA: CPBP family intramembrane glutamic endopeptidase, partial [Verrucomicrobiae bacterium]|nr:CPBP family intramembrane glutamic endopeptidase [Verrucomicrobiae bacterium]